MLLILFDKGSVVLMNKTIRVAVIDDGINEKVYNTPLEGANIEIHSDLSIVERSNYDAFLPSHGTTCAAIINTYARNVNFSSIKILNEKTEKAIKEQLIKALHWCAENEIHIASLSLGTIDFRDFEEIMNCINAVTENGLIIIAACNNKNVFTYPACLPNVIGVRCQKLYLKDQYCINDNILSGIEFAASGRHYLTDTFGNSRFTSPSNSFAVPLITAKVCDILRYNANISINGIKKELYKCAINKNSDRRMYPFHEGMNNPDSPEYIRLLESSIGKSQSIDIPVIRIIFDGSCRNEDSLYLLDNLNKLFRQDGYYSIGVSDLYVKASDNIEYFPNCEIKEKRFLSYVCQKYNCDVILLGNSYQNVENSSIDSVEEYHECDIQVFISIDDRILNGMTTVNIKIEGYCVYVTLSPEVLPQHLKHLYNTIIGLFSQEEQEK